MAPNPQPPVDVDYTESAEDTDTDLPLPLNLMNQNARKDGSTKNYGLKCDRQRITNLSEINTSRRFTTSSKHRTQYKGTSASVRFRDHLRKNHSIRVTPTEESASRMAFKNAIQDIFGKQAERQKDRNIEQEKHLKAAIQAPEFKEACARLITVRNPPHSPLDWPEFWAAILAANYVAKDVLNLARKDVPKLIESTYLLHREQLLKKLQNALIWIHFSVGMRTSPAKTGFQAVMTHWTDAETRRVESALPSLIKEFTGLHGGEEQARVFLCT
jgi:hypothetical protein